MLLFAVVDAEPEILLDPEAVGKAAVLLFPASKEELTDADTGTEDVSPDGSALDVGEVLAEGEELAMPVGSALAVDELVAPDAVGELVPVPFAVAKDEATESEEERPVEPAVPETEPLAPVAVGRLAVVSLMSLADDVINAVPDAVELVAGVETPLLEGLVGSVEANEEEAPVPLALDEVATLAFVLPKDTEPVRLAVVVADPAGVVVIELPLVVSVPVVVTDPETEPLLELSVTEPVVADELELAGAELDTELEMPEAESTTEVDEPDTEVDVAETVTEPRVPDAEVVAELGAEVVVLLLATFSAAVVPTCVVSPVTSL
ncbi:hypothetical protein BAUCODRAFT_338643 [Baudoinia panamericana UAMH 10762]|uniref:Uncharacterized protein n=1 Tax=Baudoinia panamericana (strain UAMH 10762) TaxID=717646 RepID=M2NJC6_BAUPA|nr:uncharacterized protein BAUCODRAFT_338643 [Baudoinia panamericana UAMH 10762]EMC99489.1 hypothetical protein BAUCODRAFT_338643 [Baudoinia panamericana UAMH 10762]